MSATVTAPATSPMRRRVLVLLAVAVALGLLVAAREMVGPAPRPVTDGAASQPPPMVLRGADAHDRRLVLGASSLADGHLDAARRAFADAAARTPDAVTPQIGLALARWRQRGPKRVRSDLDQLSQEHPDDAYVLLHLGLVQLFAGDSLQGAVTLRRARSLGRLDASTRDVARRADDMLHPDLAPGYPPLLLRPSDCPVGDVRCAVTVRRLATAVAADDRAGAARLAGGVDRTDAPAARLAAAVAAWDKDDPSAGTGAVDALLTRGIVGPDLAPAARFHLALLQLWSGDRARALRSLRRVAAEPHGGLWAGQAQRVLARIASA